MNLMRSPNSKTSPRDKGRVVRKHLARALIGRTVDLLVDAQTIVHGVVTGVLNEGGIPKLVVHGQGYDFKQMVTATPAAFDPQLQLQH